MPFNDAWSQQGHSASDTTATPASTVIFHVHHHPTSSPLSPLLFGNQVRRQKLFGSKLGDRSYLFQQVIGNILTGNGNSRSHYKHGILQAHYAKFCILLPEVDEHARMTVYAVIKDYSYLNLL